MLKKLLRTLGAVLLVMLILLAVFPVAFKKQMGGKLKEAISNHINGRVDYSSFDLSLIRTFPDPSFALDNFVIIGTQGQTNDTIITVPKLRFTIDFRSFFRSNDFRLISLALNGPVIKLRINSEGRANWDLIKQSLSLNREASNGSLGRDTGFVFQVYNLKTENGQLSFENDTSHVFLQANGLTVSGTQHRNTTGFDFDITTAIKELTYQMSGITYLNKAKLASAVKLSSAVTGECEFKENAIQINALHLKLGGHFKNITEGSDFNLTIVATDTAFKNLLSLVPAIYDSSFSELKSAGKFSLKGTIKGLNNETQLPAFSFGLLVEKGMFQKQGSDVPMKNISVAASVTKPLGVMDSTVIKISHLHVETGNDSVNADLLITTPSSNANIQVGVTGGFDVSSLAQFYTLEGITRLTGLLHVDLKFKGRKNDIDHKNYKLIQASGNCVATNIVCQTKALQVALQIDEACFTVTPAFISMYKMNARVGKSDFSGTAKLEQVMPYLAQQGRLMASLTLSSKLVDLRELRSKTPRDEGLSPVTTLSKPTTSEEQKRNTAIGNIHWMIRVIADKMYYDKFVFSSLTGTAEFVSDSLCLSDVSANFLGGKVVINSSSDHYSSGQVPVVFSAKASNIDIARVYQTIDDADKVAPGLKYLNGSFSGEISGNGKLKQDHSLNFDALSANGNLHYPDLKINEMPVLMQIGQIAKVKSLDHLEAKDVRSTFHFKNGKTTIDSTDIKFTNGYKLRFNGVNNPNQTVDADIIMDVPVKEFGSIASLAQNLLSGIMAVPDNMRFVFNVTGKNSHPDVKIMNVGTAGN